MIPLVSKGRSEAETAAADINYFLGLDVTDPANPKVAADFEESQAGAIPGQNHPVVGVDVRDPERLAPRSGHL